MGYKPAPVGSREYNKRKKKFQDVQKAKDKKLAKKSGGCFIFFWF